MKCSPFIYALVVSGIAASAWAQEAAKSTVANPAKDTLQANDHTRVGYFVDTHGIAKPIATPEDWHVRRDAILANVQTVMGSLPNRENLPPVTMQVLDERVLDSGIQQKEIRFLSDGDDWVHAYVMIPKLVGEETRGLNLSKKGVLCLHQTIPIGKEEPAGIGGSPNLHYAKELAQRGMVTLAPDYPSFGDHPYDFSKHPEWKSGSMKAIWDNMRAIDLMLQLGWVDEGKIGCIGHSLGGHNAIFTSVFDQRIRAVVSSCGFTRFHKYYNGELKGWTSDRYMPRISSEYANDPNRVPFDFPELIAGLAPRGFFTSSPVRDDNFDADGVRDTMKEAEFVYKLFNADGRLQAIYPDSAHDFPPAARDLAYRFLGDQLQ
jgi:hypothetical protein